MHFSLYPLFQTHSTKETPEGAVAQTKIVQWGTGAVRVLPGSSLNSENSEGYNITFSPLNCVGGRDIPGATAAWPLHHGDAPSTALSLYLLQGQQERAEAGTESRAFSRGVLTCSGLGTTKGMRASMGTTHGEMVVPKLFPRNGPRGTYSHCWMSRAMGEGTSLGLMMAYRFTPSCFLPLTCRDLSTGQSRPPGERKEGCSV